MNYIYVKKSQNSSTSTIEIDWTVSYTTGGGLLHEEEICLMSLEDGECRVSNLCQLTPEGLSNNGRLLLSIPVEIFLGRNLFQFSYKLSDAYYALEIIMTLKTNALFIKKILKKISNFSNV